MCVYAPGHWWLWRCGSRCAPWRPCRPADRVQAPCAHRLNSHCEVRADGPGQALVCPSTVPGLTTPVHRTAPSAMKAARHDGTTAEQKTLLSLLGETRLAAWRRCPLACHRQIGRSALSTYCLIRLNSPTGSAVASNSKTAHPWYCRSRSKRIQAGQSTTPVPTAANHWI
jgi:hypothetical protein